MSQVSLCVTAVCGWMEKRHARGSRHMRVSRRRLLFRNVATGPKRRIRTSTDQPSASPTRSNFASATIVKTHTRACLTQGKFEFVNGDVYAGDWVNNRRNGRGRCEYHTGEVYDGEWKDDVRAGAGDETIPRDDSNSSSKGLHETAALSGTLRMWPEPSRPRVPEAA